MTLFALTRQHLFQDITLVIFCVLAGIVFLGTYLSNRGYKKMRDEQNRNRVDEEDSTSFH